MPRSLSRHASALAIAAAFSLAAAPVAAEAHGRHGGRHGGWGQRHDGVDAGDILAGVLILGGIAAIASAAGKDRNRGGEREGYPDRSPHPNDGWRYGERDGRPAWKDSSGIDRAVDTCVAEVERSGAGVASVDAVNRVADGWRVEGQTTSGRDFTCALDRDGRVRSMTVDGRAAWNGDDGERDGNREPRFVSEPVVQPIRR